MINYLKAEANRTMTENGAVTNVSSFSDCVDLFGTIGALRRADGSEIVDRFVRAYCEDPDTAMKILFFSRDVRGGLGERRVFRTILPWLAGSKPDSLRKNIPFVAEYGRWDDLMCLLDTPCRDAAVAAVKEQLDEDLSAMERGESISLLAKWLPSVNTSSAETVRLGRELAKSLGMTEAKYRKTLSKLRGYLQVLEDSLRRRDYSFDYSKQPSNAMFKYREAFRRNDGERYSDFLEKVNSGAKKLHTGNLFPYELVRSMLKSHSFEEKQLLNTTWNALPDYCSGENALAIVDNSGSMYGDWGYATDGILPAHVALSLGLYFAERSKGYFANHFIQFSRRPALIEIRGNNFADRLSYIRTFNDVANTNLEAVFDLILSAAVNNNLPQEELPAKLYIISDMEFDCATKNAGMSVFENARYSFEVFGYRLPEIVFWNVASRNRQQPVTINDRGVALVSGCSPRIFSMVMEGELSPYEYMMSVLNSGRYDRIAA